MKIGIRKLLLKCFLSTIALMGIVIVGEIITHFFVVSITGCQRFLSVAEISLTVQVTLSALFFVFFSINLKVNQEKIYSINTLHFHIQEKRKFLKFDYLVLLSICLTIGSLFLLLPRLYVAVFILAILNSIILLIIAIFFLSALFLKQDRETTDRIEEYLITKLKEPFTTVTREIIDRLLEDLREECRNIPTRVVERNIKFIETLISRLSEKKDGDTYDYLIRSIRVFIGEIITNETYEQIIFDLFEAIISGCGKDTLRANILLELNNPIEVAEISKKSRAYSFVSLVDQLEMLYKRIAKSDHSILRLRKYEIGKTLYKICEQDNKTPIMKYFQYKMLSIEKIEKTILNLKEAQNNE